MDDERQREDIGMRKMEGWGAIKAFVGIQRGGVKVEKQGTYGEVEQVRSYGVMKFRGREDLGLVDEEEIWGRVD